MSYKGKDRRMEDMKDDDRRIIDTNMRRRDKDDKPIRAGGGRRRSPMFDDRRSRDFRDRSPHRDGNPDDRPKRDGPRFMRDERFHEERAREPFNDGIRRRFEEPSLDRRFDHPQNDSYKFRHEGYNDQFRDVGGYREQFPEPFEYRYPNDCEIIVPNKMQRVYAELVEVRLKNLGLKVDLLFPHDDTPIPQVLDDISRRGCLYAVVVLPQNEQHKSATINILWGTPQEHRNMPLDDAMNLIARSFDTYLQSVRDKVLPAPPVRDRTDQPIPQYPPPAEGSIQVLLNLLVDGRPLSVPEIDKIIRHLQERRERMLQDTESCDHSHPPQSAQPTAPLTNQAQVVPDQQAELQKRILSILNHNPAQSANASNQPMAGNWNAGNQAGNQPSTVINFDNPNVQKALDNLIQSGPSLLRSLKVTNTGTPAGNNNVNPSVQPQAQMQAQSLGNLSNVAMRNPSALNQQRHPLLGTPTNVTPGMMGRNNMMGRF